MKMHIRLRTSVAAVALALAGSGAFAMAPVDEYGRNYQGGNAASMGNDDFGNAVRSREFNDARALESSGRGSAMDKESSSAYMERYGEEATSRTPQPGPQSDASSVTDEQTPAVSEQAAANRDVSAPDAVSSEVAGSGYTKDSDLTASSASDDRLVVIVPQDWEGSVPALMSALEQSSDEAAIIVIDEDRDRGTANDGEQESSNQE